MRTIIECTDLNSEWFECKGKKRDLPKDPSQKTKKDLSLLNDNPFGNWTFPKRTLVFFVVGSYLSTLPLSSAEKTNCMKFLKATKQSENKHIIHA